MLLGKQIKQVKIHGILILLVGSLAALAGLVTLGAWLYFAQPLWGSNRPSAQSVDPARLRNHVVALSQTFHPRNHRHVDNLNRCADYIGNHFRDAGAKVSEQKYEVDGSIELKLLYPDRGNFIGIVGRADQRSAVRSIKKYMKGAADLPVYSLNAPLGALGIDMSDHRNYWNFGYDAVMITDSGTYRNSAYHSVGDTADTLDYERMAGVVVQVYEAVAGLASQADRK